MLYKLLFCHLALKSHMQFVLIKSSTWKHTLKGKKYLISVCLQIFSPYIWTCVGSIVRKLKCQFFLLVFTNMFLLSSWNLKNDYLLLTQQSFLYRIHEIILTFFLLVLVQYTNRNYATELGCL